MAGIALRNYKNVKIDTKSDEGLQWDALILSSFVFNDFASFLEQHCNYELSHSIANGANIT
eukprot:scaffold52807_cov39-Prasinocladus_malaysianus.AAC.3